MDAPPLNITYATDYRNLVDAEFLRLVMKERLLIVGGDSWITRAEIETAPGEVLADVSYFHAAQTERLVRVGEALAHLVLSDRSITTRIAAKDPPAFESARAAIRAALPEADGIDQEIPVRFWWWQPSFAQEMARMMPAPAWDELATNYGSDAFGELDQMVAWEDAPPPGGRLLLWHGPPGTGKTTAIRSLAWEWRSWAEFQFITDPEQFLANPSYLLRTISQDRVSAIPSRRKGGWRVLVLEDAGEYLAADAKALKGQALSRLLNVCDGVLGQATKTLILVTTNEPLRHLHPALSRPGRCLAEVEFAELAQGEIQRWCTARGIQTIDASRMSLAELFARAEGRAASASPAQFGFAAAV